MKKWFFVSLLCLFIFCIVGSGCSSPVANNPSNVGQNVSINEIDYGNGVYYFDAIRANFANALSVFIAKHPELRLVAIARDYTDVSHGYFVVFEKR